jgi:hypothetical protein
MDIYVVQYCDVGDMIINEEKIGLTFYLFKIVNMLCYTSDVCLSSQLFFKDRWHLQFVFFILDVKSSS